MGHVFISYIRKNTDEVDRLARALRGNGVEVWLDRDRIEPGRYWKDAIRRAIREGAFFIACFSREYEQKNKTYMNEELQLAIEELRQRPMDRVWFIPIRLSECKIPDLTIGVGRTLHDLQWLDYYCDPEWAIEKIVSVIKLHSGSSSITSPPVESLFDVRASYFTAEKEFVANQFSRLIFDRCKHLVDKLGRPIRLFVDSGTTLHPFFRYLGLYGLTSYKNGEAWIRKGKLSIVTNSIPGFSSFIESASLDAMNPNAGTAIQAFQLPGDAHAAYWAVTGDVTVGAIRELNKGDYIVIALTTGNLIRIAEGSPPYPVPLARGTKHPQIKQAAIQVADEIYVVGPLGKIIANATVEAINSAINQKTNLEDRMEYAEVMVDKPTKRIKLVSTARPRGDPLYKLTMHLRRRLAVAESLDREGFVHACLGSTNHILFPYTHSRITPDLDFPDPRSRVPEFKKFFMDP